MEPESFAILKSTKIQALKELLDVVKSNIDLRKNAKSFLLEQPYVDEQQLNPNYDRELDRLLLFVDDKCTNIEKTIHTALTEEDMKRADEEIQIFGYTVHLFLEESITYTCIIHSRAMSITVTSTYLEISVDFEISEADNQLQAVIDMIDTCRLIENDVVNIYRNVTTYASHAVSLFTGVKEQVSFFYLFQNEDFIYDNFVYAA